MKTTQDIDFNLIVPKGTQIVLLNETKILNENFFHAKGTVGKIVGLPSDAFHAYQIEFPDEVEANLTVLNKNSDAIFTRIDRA